MNVQTLPRAPIRMTIEEFSAAWTDARKERYELVDGVPQILPQVKRNHARIVSNVDFLLQSSLDRSTYNVFQSGFAIATGPRNVRHADVLVEPAGGAGQARSTEAAKLIVEVSSPSTTAQDFGSKQQEYIGLPTLDTYLILSQDRPCAWIWSRDGSGDWPEEPAVIEDGTITIATLGVSLPLAEVYRNVS